MMCLFLHWTVVCFLPHRAVSQMSEVEDSKIPQELKSLVPMPSRMALKTMLAKSMTMKTKLMKSLTMTTMSVLATLTNLDLALKWQSFSGGRRRR